MLSESLIVRKFSILMWTVFKKEVTCMANQVVDKYSTKSNFSFKCDFGVYQLQIRGFQGMYSATYYSSSSIQHQPSSKGLLIILYKLCFCLKTWIKFCFLDQQKIWDASFGNYPKVDYFASKAVFIQESEHCKRTLQKIL